MNRLFTTVLVGTVMAFSAIQVKAAILDQVKSKVYAIKADTATLKTKSTSTLTQVSSLSDLASLTEGVVSTEQLFSVIDALRPVIKLVQEQQADYQSFPTEQFRGDLSTSVSAIFALPELVTGNPSELSANILDKIQAADPFAIYVMARTPLYRIVDKTGPLADDLVAISNLAAAARADVTAANPDRAARLAATGISLAAPEFVSCEFVLNNVPDDLVDTLSLSSLRVKQIGGLLDLTQKVLPKSQTVGVTAVGGGTVSVPNPAIPVLVGMTEATDGYLDFVGKWLDKVDSCEADELSGRLSDFLASQGY